MITYFLKNTYNYNRVVSHDNCSSTAGRKLLQKILSPQSFINVSKTTKQSDASKFAFWNNTKKISGSIAENIK
jgi:hypothetical protein